MEKKEKKMKSQKKMTLTSSLIAMAISFSVLGTATFAWFTRGTTAAASGFDFTASAATGIQISTDADDWKSTITGVDFAGQAGSRITVENMEPVSTVNNSITDGELDFFGASDFDGQYTLSENTTNYLMFDLYFRNQGGNPLTLSLTANSTVIDDVLNDKNTSLATRVGFIIEGSSTDRTTAMALASGTNAYIWEPNSLGRSSSATAAPIYAVNNAKYAYQGINGDNDSTAITSNRNYLPHDVAYSAPVTTSDIAIGDTPVIGELPGNNNITKVKVFIWIEGQDIDCNNETSAGRVIVELGFDSGSSSGPTANVLSDKTATGIVGDVLSVSADVNAAGVTYNAYVFVAGTTATGDADFEIAYRQLITQGTDTEEDPNITTITLDDSVADPTGHIVVISAKFTGAIGSRTETTL